MQLTGVKLLVLKQELKRLVLLARQFGKLSGVEHLELYRVIRNMCSGLTNVSRVSLGRANLLVKCSSD